MFVVVFVEDFLGLPLPLEGLGFGLVFPLLELSQSYGSLRDKKNQKFILTFDHTLTVKISSFCCFKLQFSKVINRLYLSINLWLQLNPPNRLKQQLGAVGDDLKPMVGVSIAVRKEDQVGTAASHVGFRPHLNQIVVPCGPPE